jgi:hypothetical protein
MACSVSQPSAQAASVQFLEAHYSNWVAGVKGGGKGSDYSLRLISIDHKLSFDSLWVNNRGLSLKEKDWSGDTITLTASYFKSPRHIPEAETAPIPHEGEALISYTQNNKTHYLEVPKIELKDVPLRQ